MSKPLLVMDQHFRRVEELFSPEAFSKLDSLCRIEGALNWPMDASRRHRLLKEAEFLVAARPALSPEDLARASRLRAVIEVSGAFHDEIDYDACFARGVEVLSCAPGFQRSVAEMGLAMILAAARGLVAEHEAFRIGAERWRDDREDRDFTLFGQSVGFVGYGSIARELHRLMQPFEPDVSAYDPWVDALPDGVTGCDMLELFSRNRIVVITAVPSDDNRGLVGPDHIRAMPGPALLVLLSRAHVLDFDAACEAARLGRITFTTDVYPTEPLPRDHNLRSSPNIILSPHRAAAVEGGRRQIGDMIAHDVEAMLDGRYDRRLAQADPARIAGLVAAQAQTPE